MEVFIIIALVVAAIIVALVVYSIILEKKEEQLRRERERKFNEARRSLCIDGSCIVCGSKIRNTYAYFVYHKAFYSSNEYQKLCWNTYVRLPVSNNVNEFHTSFQGWRELALMASDFGTSNTVTICESCYRNR